MHVPPEVVDIAIKTLDIRFEGITHPVPGRAFYKANWSVYARDGKLLTSLDRLVDGPLSTAELEKVLKEILRSRMSCVDSQLFITPVGSIRVSNRDPYGMECVVKELVKVTSGFTVV